MLLEQLNPHSCKTYLLAQEGGARVVLVDPVIDHFNDYLGLLKKRGLELACVIDTHTHADHISAGAALRDATGCEYLMHENAPPKCVSLRVRDGQVLELAGIRFSVMHTPGHTGDSISLLAGDILLSGDFLFLDDGGAGRDDLPGGDPGAHWESLRRLESLPGSLLVHPAHDYRNRPVSSLDRQRRTNPHLAPRAKADFVRYLEDLKLGPADWMRDVLKANYACARDPGAAWIPVDSPACEIRGTLDKGVNEIEVGTIAPAALRSLLEKAPAKPYLIDVREPDELAGQLGGIPGAANIPIATLTGRLAGLAARKDEDIVVVCRSGGRAGTGAQILKKSGFSRVRVLDGGMLAWRREGY